ncbi:MAG: transcription-repair coupling factor [candidate division WOR-3 bacterium]|nr:MAG: transcription-repair coupling factor [candidate division WOR-3 bacterium]
MGSNIRDLRLFSGVEIIDRLTREPPLRVSGLYGSSSTLFVDELARHRPVLLVASAESYERYYRELPKIGHNITAIDPDNPFFMDSRIIVADPLILSSQLMRKEPVDLALHREVNLQNLIAQLEATGYSREDNVEEENEYAVRGGIIDVFEADGLPVRIELYGDKVFSIRKFDTQTQRSTENIERIRLHLVTAGFRPDSLMKLITEDRIIVTEVDIQTTTPSIQIVEKGEIHYNFGSPRPYFGDFRTLVAEMRSAGLSFRFLVSASLGRKLRSLLGEIEIYRAPLECGFVDNTNRVSYLTEKEIFGSVRKRKVVYKGPFVDDLMGFKELDYVVHSDFGIGQYKGLTLIDVEGKKVECLQIAYAGEDKLFLPVERMNLLERFVATDDRPPRLSKLGGELWLRTKKRVRKATERLAVELIKLYAQRMQEPGFVYSADSSEIESLETTFPYEETEDQLHAINDVKRDMESNRPAERLICGDVGYGKTEIALRASFKAALDGKQTMILCPTTLLAFQHYNTFSSRLEPFPVRVEMVSRFRKKDELAAVIDDLSKGRIDIVIGTHRLLQPDIQFHDLGLLIIDEEQRFGVAQKERIKKIRPGIDVLYLSATPIPRTLYMALSGLKNISNIHTPPLGRKDVSTHIIHFDEDAIEDILRRELERGGQIFFVHNRIQTIETVRKRLLNIIPDLRICLLHGRMREDITAKRMLAFIDGTYDMLLSTAIIESGLDIPRVNTILVDQAHKFGLADLHQLRGRVGRGETQGYAYFLVPSHGKITDEANKRLGALVSYTSLGSGFRLALRDMEIRGVGNLLGREQSGHLNAIGYHHYIRLLSDSVNMLQGKKVVHEPILDLKLDAYFPSEYIASAYERTALYKRLLEIESQQELTSIKDEIVDRFGRYPEQVENLFTLSTVRLKARVLGASEVKRRGKQYLFFKEGTVVYRTG